MLNESQLQQVQQTQATFGKGSWRQRTATLLRAARPAPRVWRL